jgi:long-chain acyl-CoA synthetase
MKTVNLVDLFHRQVVKGRDAVALRHRRDGLWHSISWKRWEELATAVASGLLSLGLEKGDTVALLARNSGSWLIADVGVLMAGGVPVPIPLGLTEEELAHVLQDSRARVVLVDCPYYLSKLMRAGAGKPLGFEKVLLLNDECIIPSGANKGDLLSLGDLFEKDLPSWLISFDEFLVYGDEQTPRFLSTLEALREADIRENDPALVIYTSGTTGVPKGVLLSHGNILFEIDRIGEVVPVDETDEQLLFLPLSHILGNVVYKTIFRTGSRLAIGEGVQRLLENTREINPTYMTAVPAFCEKLADRITALVRDDSDVPSFVFDWARRVRSTEAQTKHGLLSVRGALGMAKRVVAERVVLQDLRRVVGTRLRFMICGGAHLSPDVGRYLHTLGIPVLEGYGLTETTAATHVNRFDDPAYGTVGLPLRGVRCRIGDEGEVQVRGPNVMLGYLNDEEATKAAFTPDGWFRTGDLGTIDESGRLSVTGKAKNLIVTSSGRNIAPSKIEAHLRKSPLIKQAIVFGDNRPFLVALVVLDEAKVRERLGAQLDPAANIRALARDPEVFRVIEQEVETATRDLPRFSHVSRVAILPRDLGAERGELTETLKFRRDTIYANFSDLIDSFYV